MDLPIDNEELKELMDALNESNHPDAMKRQFRNELHRKLRLTKFLIEEGYPHKKVPKEQIKPYLKCPTKTSLCNLILPNKIPHKIKPGI